ncbi:MAG: TIGR00300 family protein [Planctomycetaceae bacterium]|nr:TIGR00300 family protein [Planctomycetales bacterium]MCB9927304.1 TIGR00300 family protein [Planctomycetaceae bacterium]
MTHSSSHDIRETVEIRGHIIDSLILPKVLDAIMAAGGSFTIESIVVGQTRHDPSFARVVVAAPTAELLELILASISDHGATPVASHDCQLECADLLGAFPEGFYSTTNQRTEVRVGGQWIKVEQQEMDCGIVVDTTGKRARCVAMSDVQVGQRLVVGHAGVRVLPEERQRDSSHGFEFMNSAVSSEKPKGVATAQIARQLFEAKASGQKILIVGGPAIVHTGSVDHMSWLIRNGYVQKLFAGNALAAHDIEQAMFGTSLGVHLQSGDIIEAGHEHHLRAINRIRRLGGIRKAVEAQQLKSGIMYECVQNDVDFLLAGSIRDDGPLQEVITDALEAQRQMRERVQDVSFCLMIATTLHSIAVGNLLPAWVRVVCVDINPSTVIKLSDRGSWQTVGLVTDVEPFLRALVADLERRTL